MGRSEIRVTINCPLKIVFDIYKQLDTWSWSDVRRIEWMQVEPWQVDSRMKFEPQVSYGAHVDQVVKHFEPYQRVDFISHFGGVTMLSQINFRALSEHTTEIVTQLEFVGTFSRVAGLALQSTTENGTRKFYDDLKRECGKRYSNEAPDRCHQVHRSNHVTPDYA